MNALPSVKFTVVATTPLEALADRLHSTIPLDMTWAPGHMCQVNVLRAHLIYAHLIMADCAYQIRIRTVFLVSSHLW